MSKMITGGNGKPEPGDVEGDLKLRVESVGFITGDEETPHKIELALKIRVESLNAHQFQLPKLYVRVLTVDLPSEWFQPSNRGD